MKADELFEKCWSDNKFGHTNDRKTLAYYAFIEGMQQVKNLNIPAVVGRSEQLVCDFCNQKYHESRIYNICDDCKQSMP